MKTLILLLFATIAQAQMPDIKIGRCAGSNPILLWSGGGPDFGEFQLVVGDGPCGGEYFRVEHGEARLISSIKVWYSINYGQERWFVDFLTDDKRIIYSFGNFHGLDHGDVINFRYLVTRKKEPKA